METHTLKSIEDAISIHRPIAAESVRQWMLSDDDEVFGAVVELVTSRDSWERIEPPLDWDEVEPFLIAQYERSIEGNPQGEWALSRFDACTGIVAWFRAVPEGEDLNAQRFLLRLRDMMRRLYLAGDEDISDAIVCGALEHILEEPRWRGFFKDWDEHPDLHIAYEQAMEWAIRCTNPPYS